MADEDEILTEEQIAILKSAFNAFDQEGTGSISMEMVGTILELMGWSMTPAELKEVVDEVDADGSGWLEFEEFCQLASKFVMEDEDGGNIEEELREAFRMYDKEGEGYITTDVLKEIFRELDRTITEEDLNSMIEEIDSDGSGTVDYEEFMEVMTGE
ncbi:troponin C, isoallergen Bla g 6.0201-like [Macrosteles quadrilineatus]|uniref:troponin C, isoallergen Bla g 6.0201-like n=1 Tax=Macrosteles quadrilineatus TaxID=74068 RepID=UPI0023E0F45D|nr:troponin C, isoallergen Bla g 6.0201-like [Macrosteles quadrilineatus]